MIHLLPSVTGLLVPHAHATGIENVAGDAPGMAEMWGSIKSLFPYTDAAGGGLSALLLRIADIILKLVAGAAVLVLIYAGILMITKSEEGSTEAKKIIMYTIIGLIAAMSADVIVNYIGKLISVAAGG